MLDINLAAIKIVAGLCVRLDFLCRNGKLASVPNFEGLARLIFHVTAAVQDICIYITVDASCVKLNVVVVGGGVDGTVVVVLSVNFLGHAVLGLFGRFLRRG